MNHITQKSEHDKPVGKTKSASTTDKIKPTGFQYWWCPKCKNESIAYAIKDEKYFCWYCANEWK